VEVVALADFTGRPAADAFSLALLGVREVVCAARDDGSAALVCCLREHLNRNPLGEMVEALAPLVPASVHRWLGPALLSGNDSPTVPQLARAARCSPRTLRRAVRAVGLPSPEQLLAWRHLSTRRGCWTTAAAPTAWRALEFSSGSALRKSLKQVTGLRPRELAAGGGLRLLAALFLRQCATGGPGRRAAGAPARGLKRDAALSRHGPSAGRHGADDGRLGYGSEHEVGADWMQANDPRPPPGDGDELPRDAAAEPSGPGATRGAGAVPAPRRDAEHLTGRGGAGARRSRARRREPYGHAAAGCADAVAGGALTHRAAPGRAPDLERAAGGGIRADPGAMTKEP
jgi:AraC-like DNA-binding protein